jgi:SAM-dependent methyltransferase
MLGQTVLLIFIILAMLIIFSTPDTVSTPTHLSITPLDKPYVDIVEAYVLDPIRIKQEVRIVKEHVIRPHTGVVIGSSTGHLVNELNSAGVPVSGIDESVHMVLHAKEKFPDVFTQGQYTDPLYQQSLSHVICVDYTFCFIKDKRTLLHSVHNWLEPGGLFFIHVPREWKYGLQSTQYTSTMIHNKLREKAILDKTYTVHRHVYWDTTERVIQLATTCNFELYHVASLPFPYTDDIILLKSLDSVIM